jgi:hypothetical protein
MERRTDWSIHLALAATATLIAMVTVTLVTGYSQETFEVFRDPVVYGADLHAHAGVVRLLFGLDSAFLILYASFFVVFARRIATSENRTLLWIATGFILATAVLDMVEDHSILSMLYGAENGSAPSGAHVTFQHVLSQFKFHVSYLGLFLFGLCIPRATVAGNALAILLTIGTVLQGAWLYAAPVALLPGGNLGRWFGFIVGFGLSMSLLRPPRSAAVTATGAPA